VPMVPSTGMSYQKNKTIVIMIVETVFLSNVSIRLNLCLKLPKVDKGDRTRDKT